MLRISYEIPPAPHQVDFLSHRLCRLWKRSFAVLERGSAAMPAPGLALSAHPAPLVFVFLLLVGRGGLFPLFAVSCLLGSDHCSFSHQIVEFNCKPNKQGTAKREDKNAFHILTFSGFPEFVFGFSLLRRRKSTAVCLESSYIQPVQTALIYPSIH